MLLLQGFETLVGRRFIVEVLAGDMLVAALLDTFPELEDAFLDP